MKIKKTIIILFIILVFTDIHIYSDFYSIDIEKLPKTDEFTDSFTWLTDNRNYVEMFIPDWTNLEIEKEKVVGHINLLLKQTDKYIKTGPVNADILLFKAVLLHYLYNLDIDLDHKKIDSAASLFKEKYPDDYRIYWVMGNHNAHGGRSVKSIKEYHYVLDNFKAESITPEFWLYYADAAGFASMFMHGIRALEKYYSFDENMKKNIAEDELYQMFTGHLKTPVFGAPIEAKEIFSIQHREEGYGVLCRLFGIYMPSYREWGFQPFDCKYERSLMIFTPKKEKTIKNTEIAYSIVVQFDANPDVSFKDYIKKTLSDFKTYEKRDLQPGNYPYIVYEAADSEIYTHMGGFHGYFVFLKRDEPEYKGIQLEAPQIYHKDDFDQGFIYSPMQEYNRYDGDIYYAIILDTCEDIFMKSSVSFITFIEGIRFD